jgi:thioredoxin-related protein
MKKRLFFLYILFNSLAINAQETVKWLSFEKAIELNKTNQKQFLVSIYTDWCGWCKKMDTETYTNPIIAKYINDNYHAIKLNGEGKEPITFNNYTFKQKKQGNIVYHELSAAMLDGKLSYPTTIILNKEVQLLDRIPGYLTPRKMEMVLAYFMRKDRDTKNWGDFSKEFINSIKE